MSTLVHGLKAGYPPLPRTGASVEAGEAEGGAVSESLEGETLRRREREVEDDQPALFELPPDWKRHWWGMPAFEQRDARPAHRITVNFIAFEDVEEFARRLGLRVGRQTDSVWFPLENVDRPNDWEYTSEP